MRNTSFLPTRSMTKQDVLNTIRDSYRFAQKLDPEAEPGFDLTFDTTIQDWRAACDLLPARELGHALNSWFDVQFSDPDWIATLEPAKTATLGGVCKLIASEAKMPEIREFPVMGAECLSAGAFLTIRTALASEGVPLEEIRPSTPLEPIALKHLSSLITAVGRIAPGALPIPEVKYKLAFRSTLWLCGGGFIMALFADLASSPRLASASLVFGLIGLMSAVLLGRFGQSLGRVHFLGIRNFRDLTHAIIRRKRETTNLQ